MCVCKIELDEILIIEIIYLQIKVHVPGLKAKITRLNHFLHKIFVLCLTLKLCSKVHYAFLISYLQLVVEQVPEI